MAVTNAIFIFEVVVAKVTSFVQSRHLVIRSEFSDIFSLELRDPKTMHIVIPEAPPPPPEPPGKKGKKGKKKPKPKKRKKGKKAVEPPPPPEPDIQSGQSVLFTSNAEFLYQNMKKFPMEVSLWSKEDHFVYIGSTRVAWDPKFNMFLERIMNCEHPPPIEIRDDYNIFEEGSAKIIAKLGLKVTLRYLSDRVTSSFRSLSEDPAIRKFLYTGMNSKVTSFICTMKTTEETFEKNCNKIENSYVKDRPIAPKPIEYADFKNAPGIKVLLNDPMECCLRYADKPPDSKYKSPETCPDIDFITDYVRKVIVSCNDSMRMMTPRPTIRPRIRATDIDRLCYCRETSWPQSKLADRFREEVQGPPCPICHKGERQTGRGSYKDNFDLACVRGPCGSTECKVAREVRTYIEKLVMEDNEQFNLADLIGPCGSKKCSLVEQIANFLQHRGAFEHADHHKEALATQCACLEQMQTALMKRASCTSVCSNDCEEANSSETSERCGGPGCPFTEGKPTVYQVFYFTVEYDNTPPKTPPKTPPTETHSSSPSAKSSKITSTSEGATMNSKGSATSDRTAAKYKHCTDSCTDRPKALPCSKSLCFEDSPEPITLKKAASENKCVKPVCPSISETLNANSPPDSHVQLRLEDIHNPCCVKSCEVAEKVQDFIMEGLAKSSKKKGPLDPDDPCYCDCACDFRFSRKTTYCAVCGGYECLGDDTRALPEYKRPHPCPVYHKMYDRKYISTQSPWPQENAPPAADAVSTKSGRTTASKGGVSTKHSVGNSYDAKKKSKKCISLEKKKKKKVSKFTANTGTAEPHPERHLDCINSLIPVPKNMGWNWKADDIPGLKYRPDWRPGCALKLLVRKYRAIREPLESILAKKKRAMMKKKKLEMKPTLIVTKKNGEYNVQMEVFKNFSKERLLYQYPYDESKKPLIYTIGKTEEEKTRIQKQRERRERRTTRRKCRLLQSAFRDKCQEICVKAYNQAIGLLPLPNANDPDCPCAVKTVNVTDEPIIDSCSCSESETISSSDTDGDDWAIEFTAPMARWDIKAKHILKMQDDGTQYTYLDYKVKLVDKQGNPVPRFFKGPDGRQECSDLGGFWSPDHKTWLEINRDGYVGPDNRWVPMSFIGPDGMLYSADDGFFTDSQGKQYKIGVEGYIDCAGKWAWYSRGRGLKGARSTSTVETAASKRAKILELKKGRAAVKEVPGKKGVTTAATQATSHGTRIAKGNPPPIVSPPDKGPLRKVVLPPGVRAKPHRCQLWMAKTGRRDGFQGEPNILSPSPKYMNTAKIAKYNEIMQDLSVYDDLFEMKTPRKANRACMTSLVGGPLAQDQSFYAMVSSPPPPPSRVPRSTYHPRVRPIDSMKIYGLDSLRTQAKHSFTSRSGLKTSSSNTK